MTRPSNRPILTVQEVRARLAVCRRTVYVMLADGRLRGYKLRGKWKIYETSVKSYQIG